MANGFSWAVSERQRRCFTLFFCRCYFSCWCFCCCCRRIWMQLCCFVWESVVDIHVNLKPIMPELISGTQTIENWIWYYSIVVGCAAAVAAPPCFGYIDSKINFTVELIQIKCSPILKRCCNAQTRRTCTNSKWRKSREKNGIRLRWLADVRCKANKIKIFFNVYLYRMNWLDYSAEKFLHFSLSLFLAITHTKPYFAWSHLIE